MIGKRNKAILNDYVHYQLECSHWPLRKIRYQDRLGNMANLIFYAGIVYCQGKNPKNFICKRREKLNLKGDAKWNHVESY